MIKTVEIRLSPGQLGQEDFIINRLARTAGVEMDSIRWYRLQRKSLDARGKTPEFLLRYELFIDEDPPPDEYLSSRFKTVDDRPEITIVGAGPAGYFAALKCIELGYRPLVFDRGKDVQARRRDLRAIQQFSKVDPDSNYCFGEGGAGTYSDGKLYTRSLKRGNYEEVLQLLVEHGAPGEILADAHPHIGSNKLPAIVTRLRQTIERAGGQVRFDSKLTGIEWKDGHIERIEINGGEQLAASALILATGHSARDVYELLHARGLKIEIKPFALGVRIEHPQALIDRIQYNTTERHPELPASSYRLACNPGERGVFSFCMCPGGLIVPAATSPGEIVVNGMSLSRRDSAYANAGTVVAVNEKDVADYRSFGPLAAMAFQAGVEKKMFAAGDGSQAAPAQRLTDFVEGRLSSDLPDTSYIPGIHSARVDRLLPPFIYRHLQQGIGIFGKRMKGYYTGEAIVVGTESRTSAPVRIPRDRDSFMHPDVRGLFPCGEGAGYAGGILSAAMDGQNCARAAVSFLKQKKVV